MHGANAQYLIESDDAIWQRVRSYGILQYGADGSSSPGYIQSSGAICLWFAVVFFLLKAQTAVREDVLEGSASRSHTPDTPAASLPGGGREKTINGFGLFFQRDLGSLAEAAAFSQHAVGGAPRLTPLIANPLLGCRTDPVRTCLVINSPAPPARKGHHEYVWMLHPLPQPSPQLASRHPALIDFTCNVRRRVNQGTEQRVFPL